MRFSKFRKLLLFLMDIGMTLGSYFLVGLLLGGKEIDRHYIGIVVQHLLLIGLCYSVSLFAFKMYDSLWRYAESQEYLTLIISVAVAFVVYRLLELLLPVEKLAAAVGITAAPLALLAMLLARFSYRQYRNRKKLSHKRHIRLAIVGAGSAGATLLYNIQSNTGSNYLPVCFFDDDPVKIGKVIHGVSIVGPVDGVPQYCKAHNIQELIIAMPSVSSSKRRKVISDCARTGCDVKILPDTVLLLEINMIYLNKLYGM